MKFTCSLLGLALVVGFFHPASGIAASNWDIHPTPLDRLNDAGVELTVQAISEVLRAGADDDLRYWSALALAQLEDVSAIPALVGALKDDHRKVRIGAADALGYFSTPEASAALGSAATDVSDHVLRKVAVISLGKIRDENAARGLVESALNTAENVDIRYQAIYMLGAFAGRKTMAELLPLNEDGDARIRAISRLSLSKSGVPIAVETLVDSATDSEVDEFTFLQIARHLEMTSGEQFLTPDDTVDVQSGRELTQSKIAAWWEAASGTRQLR